MFSKSSFTDTTFVVAAINGLSLVAGAAVCAAGVVVEVDDVGAELLKVRTIASSIPPITATRTRRRVFFIVLV